MRCARCGGRVTGATWYCKHCGSAVGASGGYSEAPRSRGRSWLLASGAVLASVLAIGVLGGRLLRPAPALLVAEPGAGQVASGQVNSASPDLVWPTPSPVPLAEDDPGGAEGPSAPGSREESAATTSGTSGRPAPGGYLPGPQSVAAAPDAPLEAGESGGGATLPEAPAPSGAGAAAAATTLAGADSPNATPGGEAATAALPVASATRSAGSAAAGAPVWTAGQPPGRVILDGELDDWASESIDVAQVAFGGEQWEGPADLSARAFMAFDAANLYLAVRVTDDIFSQPSSGADLHLGDSIELQLDTDLVGDFGDATYNADDWQIGLSPGDFAGKSPEAHVWRPEGPPTGVRVASRQLATGYIVEAAIPWQRLGVDPAGLSRIGVAINVSDNDYPSPAQVTMVSSVPARSWDNPGSFGTLVLRRAAP